MIEKLYARLAGLASKTGDVAEGVRELARQPSRVVGARELLFRPGAPAAGLFFITAGIACRYDLLSDGRRQITQFLLPGDLFGVRTCIDARFDHHVESLTALEISSLTPPILDELRTRAPCFIDALWSARQQEQAVFREWLINVGQRSAIERVAHLFCELFTRLQAAGLTIETCCMLPLTQIEIAHAVALTPVHVNRTLMELSRRGWLTFRRGVLDIRAFATLADIAGFDAGYLESPRPDKAQARLANRLRGTLHLPGPCVSSPAIEAAATLRD
jgi:CRP-like cAMP-binding protein